jgi:hypothetical protein
LLILQGKPYYMSANLLKFMNANATNTPVEGKTQG